jgi:hypothetical protein
MTVEKAIVGPGSVRVGRFIGRLGVVSLPAVAAGLDLEERVVRRHVAKLETAGWLARAPWVWGEGSVAWLTTAGIRGTGLGSVRAVKSYPSPGTIAHGVLVGWSAARTERRGRVWRSARELAVDGERWAVPARCERGSTTQLPDLAAWVDGRQAPVAVIAECGGRREDRQRWILESWGDAIRSGDYCAVRYECESEAVVRWITRLAKKVGLAGAGFTATVQSSAAEIAAMSPELARAEAAARETARLAATEPPSDRLREPPAREPPSPEPSLPPAAPVVAADEPVPVLGSESDEASAERVQHWREILGMDEAPRRRWGRRR